MAAGKGESLIKLLKNLLVICQLQKVLRCRKNGLQGHQEGDGPIPVRFAGLHYYLR